MKSQNIDTHNLKTPLMLPARIQFPYLSRHWPRSFTPRHWNTTGRSILLALLWVIPSAGAAATQSHASIRDTVHAYVSAATAEQALPAEVVVGRLDSRLRLTRCSEKLEAFRPPGRELSGKTTVGVRCTGEKPWSLYVPVTIKIMGTVLVAAEDLPRGSLITEDKLRTQRHDLSKLHRGYLTDPKSAVGKQAKRRIRQGQIIHPRQIASVQMVKKGEEVTILAQSGRVEIRAKGKALSHGAENDKIPVRNLQSKKVLEARVLAPGVVRVDL